MSKSKRLKGSVLVLSTLLLFSVLMVAPVFAIVISWWDDCEALDAWTFSNGGAGYIDTNIQQEGDGCIRVTVQNGALLYAENTIENGTENIFGFWVYMEAGSLPNIQVRDEGGTYFFGIYFHPAFSRFFGEMWNSFGYTNFDTDLTWDVDTWYWIEFQDVQGDYVWRINGAVEMVYANAGTYGDFTTFQVKKLNAGGVSQYVFFDYLRVTDTFEYPPSAPPSVYFDVSADLEDIDDDGADWVFTDWKYYNFTVTVDAEDLVGNPILNVSFYFNVPTGEEIIPCVFFSDGENWTYASNMTYEHREGEPIRLNPGSWSSNATHHFITFFIWFEDRILDVWDPSGVDVFGSFNSCVWFTAESSLFRIYSKGGFEMNFASSGYDAGKIVGGSPFSLYSYNGSIVYNEIWYRDGQHIKLLPDIHFLAGLDEFYVRYGVDYSLGDGEWLKGWELSINPKFVSYTGIFAANVWINMTNQWVDREGIGISTSDLYMFYHGSVTGEGDIGHFKSWVDLWFSDKNASTVGAGKYNAYEFPMIDSADLWLRWLANNWGVKDNVFKEMSVQTPLLDTDNSTVISSEQIKMMRFWCELEVADTGGGQSIHIQDYSIFDITRSKELPLVGMSDPVFDETLIPTVGQRGILGALWSMFSGLGQWLSENIVFGGLNLWGTFVNFLDTIAAMFGAPKFFTNLFTWIAELIGYVGESVGYLGDILSALFSLFGSLMGAFLITVADLIYYLVNTVTMVTDALGGAYGAGVNVWETLGVSSWITVAMICYPLYLIILWEEKGLEAVIQQLTWIFGILSWLFSFSVQLIQFVIRLITSVIESIPVAE